MATTVFILKFLILLHLVVIEIYGSDNVVIAIEQQKYRNFVVGDNQLVSMKVVSPGMCSYQCLCNIDCVSFFFNTERRTCKLHSVLFPAPAFWTPDKAWRYYQVHGEVCDPSHGYIHQRHLALCYKRYGGDDVQTAVDAARVCEGDGAELVRVDSAEKQQHLAEYLGIFRDDQSYIQGNDMTEKGTWRFDDGEKMTYFHWSSKHDPDGPDGQKLNYLVMSKSARFGWDNVSGMDTFPFVCEKRLRRN